MRKKILSLVLTGSILAGTLLNPSRVYAYESDFIDDINMYEVTELEDEGIKAVQQYAVTELDMLNDIVERSYNNNFDVKSYIIEVEGSNAELTDINTMNLYLSSKGEVPMHGRFVANAVVRTSDKSYFSVTADVQPNVGYEDESGNLNYKYKSLYDRESRKIIDDVWNVYKENIRKAEIQMGYYTLDEQYDKDGLCKENALCDYQKMVTMYAWIANHVQYGPGYVNEETEEFLAPYCHQTAYSMLFKTCNKEDNTGFIYGEGACAGYARLFNRFMHDFGIESYYLSMPSIHHANNLVKLKNKYYGVDINGAVLNEINSDVYKNHNNQPLSNMYTNMFSVQSKEEFNVESTPYRETTGIITYNKDLVNTLAIKIPTCYNREDLTIGKEPQSGMVTDENGTEWFEKQSTFDENCVYCGKAHKFPYYNDNTKPIELDYYETFNIKTAKDNKGNHISVYIDTTGTDEYYGEVKHFKVIEGINSSAVDVPEEETSVIYSAEEITSQEATTLEESTTPQETSTTEEVPTPPTRPIETTTSEEETPSIVVPTKPVETTKKVEVPVTTPKQTTTTEKETTTKKVEETTTKATAKPSKVKKVTAKNNKKKSIKITWKKTTNAKKYQIQYSTSKKFKKKVVTKTTKKLKYTIKKFAKGKTYYIRVRGINGKEVGKWSKIKKVKIKK